MFTGSLCCQILLGCLLLQSCRHGADQKSLIPVRIMIGRSTSWLPLLLAQRLNFAEKHGLKLSIEEPSSTTKSTQALLGGSVDVAGGMYEQTLSTGLQGHTLTSFVTLMTGDYRALVVSPQKAHELQNIRDLKGVTVGVSAIGSPNQFLVSSIASRHGLSSRDLSIVAVGVFTSAVAALERGKVDAAVLSGSGINLFLKRHPEGRVLLDVRTSDGQREAFGVDRFLTAVLYSTPEWLASHKDTARRLATATCDGLRWIQEHSPDEIAHNMPDSIRTEFDVDRDAVEALKPNFSPDGRTSLQLASNAKQAFTRLPENGGARNVDVSRTFTNEFLGK